MDHKHDVSARTLHELAAFLDSHLGAAYQDDVGPLFGLASQLHDRGEIDTGVHRQWTEAVNAALSA